ncbi:MAG TPA: forkhead-associated protein [Planctomycetaceae bacterium]|nr:forkhead-associated protein [Planctomycetaceae bacterium]
MFGELVPVGGGDPIPLLRERLLIGRRSRCDIHLDFPNVSSQHCELEMDSGYWQVRDLRSTNGVKVNGQRVEVQVLMPGDTLTVGKHEFEVVYRPLSDGPPPSLTEEDPFSRSLLEQAGLEGRRKAQRRSERLKKQLPPAVQSPSATGEPDDGGGEDTEILGWLTDDDVAE